jgi:ACS family tartrate transporter-like MFS transporter
MSDSKLERETMRVVYWHFTPLFFVIMLLNYLDRFNIGYAALRMNHDLALSPRVFGFGASIFFLGYMVFEIPSNLILHRIGGRVWISRILITWGAIAAAMAFVAGAKGFFILRFLLGVAEAGLLPGLALFTTAWFPAQYRATAVGGYIVAGQLASVVAGPLSTALMTYCNGLLSLRGWQWMFILEGVPTIFIGVMALHLLTERPADASWLRDDQKSWLMERLRREHEQIEARGSTSVIAVLRDGRVWGLTLLFGCALVGIDGLHFWQPQIIRSFGKLSDMQVGLLSAIPALLSAFGTVAVSFNSDRTGDRKLHLGTLYTIGAIGFAASALVSQPVVGYLLLCLAGIGVNSGNSLFWSINSSLTTGAAAAFSIALVNTLAQFGGLVGPWMIGAIKNNGNGFSTTLLALSAFTLVAAGVSFSLRIGPSTSRSPVAASSAPARKPF